MIGQEASLQTIPNSASRVVRLQIDHRLVLHTHQVDRWNGSRGPLVQGGAMQDELGIRGDWIGCT